MKKKQIIREIKKLITKTLPDKDLDLVYTIKPTKNCSENCGYRYAGIICMKKKEYVTIDTFLKIINSKT